MTTQTRRHVLTILAATTLAGCASTNTPKQKLTQGSVFKEISFENTKMVIHLRDDHQIDRLNLISPDGSRFTTKAVPVGATTVKMEILSPPSPSKHYKVGVNELVGVRGGKTVEKRQFNLTPHIEIVNVRSPTRTQEPRPGAVLVSLKNTGSGPTWVYDITFQDTPSWIANKKLSTEYRYPRIGDPSNPEDTIITPGEVREFVAPRRPVVFSKNDWPQGCGATVTFNMQVGSGDGEINTSLLKATTSGDEIPEQGGNSYACTVTRFELEVGT